MSSHDTDDSDESNAHARRVAEQLAMAEDVDEDDVDRSEAIEQLQKLDQVGEKRAEALYESGFRSIEDIASTHASKLLVHDALGDATAARIWHEARNRTGAAPGSDSERGP